MSKNDLDAVLAKQKTSVEDILSKLSPIDGNKVIKEIKADRKKTAKNSGTIRSKGKVIASAKGSKPLKAEVTVEEIPLTPKESFLKQIEDYNDFIIQNDLDDEQINPSHDYDFTAFTSPQDWAVESKRLSDRMSDRKIEIKQNEVAGEFAGLELENSVPSYEAVKEMSPEQYTEYEQKYLAPSADEFKKTENVPVEVKISEPEADLVVSPIIDSSDPVVTLVPADINDTNTSPKHDAIKKVLKPKQKSKPSSLDAVSLMRNSLPFPIKSALDSALEAVGSANKVIDQGQLLNALEDAGKGVMNGLAETTGDILDVGGFIPNRVADTAHESADWWKDQFVIPDSEAGKIGSNIGTDAVTGLIGGAVGKVAGNVYKNMRLGGEALRKNATEVAIDRQKLADDYVDYGHKFLNKIGYPASIRPNKISYKDAPLVRQNTYENITNVLPRKTLSSGEPLTDVLSHNIKRNFDNRAMLKRNDLEIESMFNQGTPLDQVLKIQQNRWDQIPDTARDAGLLMGIAQ